MSAEISFPAWRLKNGIKNATDEQLEHAAESCEWWSWGCAAILLVGLFAEGILAWNEPPHEAFWGRWGTFIGSCLVFVGVAGEVGFGIMGTRRHDELMRRTQARLAEAMDRASQATVRSLELQVELERVRSWRTLDGPQFLQALQGRPSWRIAELLHAEGTDTGPLAGQIWSLLSQTDWKCPRPKEIHEENPTFDRADWDGTLLGTWGAIAQGITIVVNAFPPPDEPHPAWTLVNALEAGLPGDNYVTVGVDRSVADEEIRIVVSHRM